MKCDVNEKYNKYMLGLVEVIKKVKRGAVINCLFNTNKSITCNMSV